MSAKDSRERLNQMKKKQAEEEAAGFPLPKSPKPLSEAQLRRKQAQDRLQEEMKKNQDRETAARAKRRADREKRDGKAYGSESVSLSPSASPKPARSAATSPKEAEKEKSKPVEAAPPPAAPAPAKVKPPAAPAEAAAVCDGNVSPSSCTELKGHTEQVVACAWSVDCETVLSASHDRSVRVWKWRTGEQVQNFEGHTARVYDGCLSADASLALSCSGDESVRVWDVPTGAEIKSFWGHDSAVRCCAISPDNRMCASAATNGCVKIWNTASGQCMQTLEGHLKTVRAVAFSPDGAMLATCGDDATIKLWSIATGTVVETMNRTHDVHEDVASAVGFSPKGKFLATGSYDSSIAVWQWGRPRLIKKVPRAHKGHVHAVAFCAPGTVLATSGDDMLIKLWNCNTWTPSLVIGPHTQPCLDIAFSLDNRFLLSACNDGIVRVLQLQEHESINALMAPCEVAKPAPAPAADPVAEAPPAAAEPAAAAEPSRVSERRKSKTDILEDEKKAATEEASKKAAEREQALIARQHAKATAEQEAAEKEADEKAAQEARFAEREEAVRAKKAAAAEAEAVEAEAKSAAFSKSKEDALAEREAAEAEEREKMRLLMEEAKATRIKRDEDEAEEKRLVEVEAARVQALADNLQHRQDEIQDEKVLEQKVSDQMLAQNVAMMRDNINETPNYTTYILTEFQREALTSGALCTVGIAAEVTMFKKIDNSMTYGPYLFKITCEDEVLNQQRFWRQYNHDLQGKRDLFALAPVSDIEADDAVNERPEELIAAAQGGLPFNARADIWEQWSGSATKRSLLSAKNYDLMLAQAHNLDPLQIEKMDENLDNSIGRNNVLWSEEGGTMLRDATRRLLLGYLTKDLNRIIKDKRRYFLPGMESVASMMLLMMSEMRAYFLFTATYDDLLPGIFEADGFEYCGKQYAVVNAMLLKQRPELHAHMLKTRTSGGTIMEKVTKKLLYGMITNMCLGYFPAETTMRIWDLFYVCGPVSFACTLTAVYTLLEKDFMEFSEMEEFVDAALELMLTLQDSDTFISQVVTVDLCTQGVQDRIEWMKEDAEGRKYSVSTISTQKMLNDENTAREAMEAAAEEAEATRIIEQAKFQEMRIARLEEERIAEIARKAAEPPNFLALADYGKDLCSPKGGDDGSQGSGSQSPKSAYSNSSARSGSRSPRRGGGSTISYGESSMVKTARRKQARIGHSMDVKTIAKLDKNQQLALVPRAHRGQAAHGCSIHPNGKVAVTCGSDCTLKLWNVPYGGDPLATLEGHTDSVACCMIGADGAILSGSNDGTLRLYELTEDSTEAEPQYECVQEFKGHTKGVLCCYLSEDGFQVLSGSADETVKVWDRGSAKCVLNLRTHVGKVFCAEFSPRDTHIVSGGEDLIVRIWEGYMDLDDEGEAPKDQIVTPIQTLEGHQTPVMAAKFSPDGLGMASAARSGNVRLWLWAQQVCLFSLIAHNGVVEDLDFNVDGSLLATCGSGGKIKVWYTGDFSLQAQIEKHGCGVSGVKICPIEHVIDPRKCKTEQVNRPGRFVAAPSSVIMSVAADGSMCMWDYLAAKDKMRLEGIVEAERDGFKGVRARGLAAQKAADEEAAARKEDNKERVRAEAKIIEEMAEEMAAQGEDALAADYVVASPRSRRAPQEEIMDLE